MEGSGFKQTFEDHRTESIQTGLGATFAMEEELDEMTLVPEFNFHWFHEFNNGEEDLSYTLSSGVGTPVSATTRTRSKDADFFRIGTGLGILDIGENSDVSINYSYEFSSSYVNQTVSLTYKYLF